MAVSLKKILFRMPPDECTFAKRGFGDCDPEMRDRLEEIGRVFEEGYTMALEIADHVELAAALDERFDAHHVGFAYEAAGFYYALLDVLMPRRQSRLRAFTDDAARKYDYIASVGGGFALARMPWGRRALGRTMRKLDSVVARCVPDGYGFHQAFFHHRRFVEQCAAPPSGWPNFACRLFDAGVGRSLWWVCGADPERIRQAIDRFDEIRRAELWCGVGLACAYAGGVDEDQAKALPEAAGVYHADVRSGALFAASMRQQANNLSPWTERVCRLFLGMPAYEAGAWVDAEQDRVLAGLPHTFERGGRSYLLVRQRVTRALLVTGHGSLVTGEGFFQEPVTSDSDPCEGRGSVMTSDQYHRTDEAQRIDIPPYLDHSTP